MASQFSVSKSYAFAEAAAAGDLETVVRLSHDPEVDLEWENPDPLLDSLFDTTAIVIATKRDHVDVVRYLLAFDERPMTHRGLSLGFFMESEEMADLLLADDRIEVNQKDEYGNSLLNKPIRGYKPGIVARILACHRFKDWEGKNRNCETELQRVVACRKPLHAPERAWAIPLIDRIEDLLKAFQADSPGTRERLRRELGLNATDASDTFALMVFLSDNYLEAKRVMISTPESVSNAIRALSIGQSLPMELQMVICNRAFGISKDHVSVADSNDSFKYWGKKFSQGK